MVCLLCMKYLSPKTTLEVSGDRFQPQRQRHVLEVTPEASGHEKEDTREAELAKKQNQQRWCQLVDVPSRFVSAVTGVCRLS